MLLLTIHRKRLHSVIFSLQRVVKRVSFRREVLLNGKNRFKFLFLALCGGVSVPSQLVLEAGKEVYVFLGRLGRAKELASPAKEEHT